MKSRKKFETVKMMRTIRDKLSKEIKNMSYEEQKKYIKDRIRSGQFENEKIVLYSP
jgi:hypothetical protein